jgi:GAF domain-containing protein
VIAIENVRLFTELQEKNRALTQAHAQVSDALEQQTATSEILKVISSSPTDLQPVFDTIVESVVQLCDGVSATVYRFDGELIHLVAHHHSIRSAVREVFERVYPLPPSRKSVVAQAILDRAVIHVRDFENDPRIPLASREMARAVGHRSLVAVPMLRPEGPIGAISVGRRGPHDVARPFSENEISLLKTFADQAVIAVENVRLFKELEARNADLTGALAQQIATAEILRVISSSPTDTQPVFDTIVESARQLLSGHDASLSRVIGDMLHLEALTAKDRAADEAARKDWPRPITGHGGSPSRAVRDRAPMLVGDVQTDPAIGARTREQARLRGFRSAVSVPMLREGEAIGVISVTRPEPGAFTDEEVSLLKTFADQAVIAIENVRLFTELQASNRELTTALDTQTATSDILRVISRSQTDVQPVFDAIVNSAVRLLRANTGVVIRIAGEQIELAAITSTDEAGDAALRASFPRPVQSEGASTRVIRDRAPLNIADAHTDPRVSDAAHAYARVRGYLRARITRSRKLTEGGSERQPSSPALTSPG